MKFHSGLTKSMFYSLCAFFLLSTLTSASSYQKVEIKIIDKGPNVALKKELTEIFQNAEIFMIKFQPAPEPWAEVVSSPKHIDQDWRYSAGYRCVSSCTVELRDLRERLESGRLILGSCPAPWIGKLEFFNAKNVEVAKVYVNGFNTCFELHGKSFYLSEGDSLERYFSALPTLLRSGP